MPSKTTKTWTLTLPSETAPSARLTHDEMIAAVTQLLHGSRVDGDLAAAAPFAPQRPPVVAQERVAA